MSPPSTIQARVWADDEGVKYRLFVVRGERVFDLRKARWLDKAALDDQDGAWLVVRDDRRPAPDLLDGGAL